MAKRYLCLICQNEIPHAGAECPHCRLNRKAFAGATPQVLVLLFAAMFGLFVFAGILTASFRAEKRARAERHATLALTLSQYGDYEHAIEHYREALTYSRDNYEYRLGLALALYYLERFGEAELQLVELRAADPTRGVVNRILGRIAGIGGRPADAENYYRTAIFGRWVQSPAENRLKTRFELIELLESQGKKLQAIGELVELLAIVPDDNNMKRRIGELFLDVGSPLNAARIFEDLVKAAPDDPLAHYGLGRAEFAQGNYISAVAGFEKAKRLGAAAPDLGEQLELARAVVDLDPTARGLPARETYRRGRELLRRGLAALEYCLNPAPQSAQFVGPLPQDLDELLSSARGIASGKTRQRADQGAIESNISLAEALWARRLERCPDIPIADQPLSLVLDRLGQ
jgi:tetratricopeptide (TPR) repeat protein